MDNGAGSYRRFLDGDESAFDEIMEELFFSLVFFVDRYVHDTHAAEDIAVDAISDLFVHRHRYNFKVSLKTYVFMLGKSRALNYLKHRRILEIAPLDDAADSAPSDEEELEDIVLKDEMKRKVSRALSELPADMREAVHLVYFEDMTYDETAKVMGINRKKTDNLLYRAKKELRTILGKEGESLL